MKLKNKQTGEIVIANVTRVVSGVDFDCGQTLAELNAEWEDAPEEPKEHWTLGHDGAIFKLSEWENQKDHEEIGNYFSSREEAELAVRKLKAWKRLKDKGFRFFNNKVIIEYGNVSYKLIYPVTAVEKQDLDLLFGGEE